MMLAEPTTHGPLALQRPVDPGRQLQVAAALQSALPAHCVLWRDEDTRPYECDGLSMYRQLPMVVVLPETEAHVIKVLKICRDLAVPVVARGAGTGLSGGAMPHAEGVLLGMAKFNRITQVDPLARTATVQPGVRNLAIRLRRLLAASAATLPRTRAVCIV
jgi:glycolate oxidase